MKKLNVWFQLIDNKGVSIYKSWTSKGKDSLIDRDDIKKMLKNPEIKSYIGVDSFTIAFRALVPIYDNKDRFLGILSYNSL